MQIWPNMRRIRPLYRLEYAPVRRPPEFPLTMLRQREHRDQPIQHLHIHDCLEIGLCHRGRGVFAVGEKVFSFAEGDVIVITRDEPHYARSAPDTTSDWTWIWFDPATLGGPGPRDPALADTSAWAGRDFVNVIPRSEGECWHALVSLLVRELEQREAGWQEAVRGHVQALLVMGHRRAPARKMSPGGGYARVGPALDYLGRHFREAVSSQALAKLCGFSDTHFRREFQRAIGKAVHQYLLELRVLAAAAEIRAGDKTIAESAYACGFESLSSFQRAFRARLGCAPSEWRRLDKQ